MQMAAAVIPVEDALARIEAALDGLDPDRVDAAPERRLAWVSTARRLRSRLDALTGLLTAEAEKAQASEQAVGTPLASWLGTTEVISRKEAAREVFTARNLGQHHEVGQAAAAGTINPAQATAIGRVLADVSEHVDASRQTEAERLLVGMAATMDAAQLTRSAPQVLRHFAPDDVEERLEVRLQRQAEAAQRSRSLRWWREAGSVRFEGSLPRVEGERFITVINAHAQALRRTALEARDPLRVATSPEQRRADALISMLTSVEKAKPQPGVGGAKVIVTLDYQRLHDAAAGAGLIGDGRELSAGELRRLCCDAHLVPAVLGGASEVLDVGRASRLVTPAIRTALTLRDRGCAFPGCDTAPELCEAHHITPWWAGGVTAEDNLVLLCHTHHGLIEPAKHGLRDQWRVHIDHHGAPAFIPPARFRQGEKHGIQAHPPPLTRFEGRLDSCTPPLLSG